MDSLRVALTVVAVCVAVASVEAQDIELNPAAALPFETDLDKAISKAAEAIERQPNSAKAYYNRGLIWVVKNQPF